MDLNLPPNNHFLDWHGPYDLTALNMYGPLHVMHKVRLTFYIFANIIIWNIINCLLYSNIGFHIILTSWNKLWRIKTKYLYYTKVKIQNQIYYADEYITTIHRMLKYSVCILHPITMSWYTAILHLVSLPKVFKTVSIK